MKHKKIIKTSNKQILFKKAENFFLIHKSLLKKHNKFIKKQIPHQNLIQKMPVYFTKIKICCVLTGRSKHLFKNLKIARFQIKKIKNDGIICGLKNATW